MSLLENLKKYDKEFIGIDGELFQIKVDLIPYADFDNETKLQLQTLIDRDPVAQASLDILKITDTDERIIKFTLCRFGGFDNQPDISDGVPTTEYYDCGERGSCPVEGKLCKYLKVANGHLTPREMEIIKLMTKDLLDKQMADLLGISVNTLATHRRNIEKKLNVFTKSGVCVWAVEHGIIS